MPCYDSRDSPEYQSEDNLKRFGVRATTDGLTRGVACAAMHALESAGVLEAMPEWAVLWYQDHKERDKEAEETERRIFERCGERYNYTSHPFVKIRGNGESK